MTIPRQLSEAALERLLAALADDREAAAVKLVELRHRLEKFFEWSRCAVNAGDLSWEVLARVAGRLQEGEEILKVEAYAAGVARLVAREELARARREVRAAVELELQTLATASARFAEDRRSREVAAQALDRCLAKLPTESRDLLLRYYEGEEGARIRNRQRLASELGISLNALRNRALRLREQVEKALRDELRGDEVP